MNRATSSDPGKSWRGAHGIPIVAAFDGYRAVAIIGVVLFHIFQVSGAFAVLGRSAGGIISWGLLPRSLDVLFIVSGFVIYLPTAARFGNFGRVSAFAVRRAARLFPAYWTALVVALILLATVGAPGTFPGAGAIVAHFAVLQTPALLVSQGFPLGLGVIQPVWTLSVEIGFYIVLPLVAGFYFRRPFVGLACAAALLVLWRWAALHPNDVAGVFDLHLSAAAKARINTYYASQFPSWAFAIAAGMTGAWAYVRLRDRFDETVLARRALMTLGVAGLAMAGLVYLAGHDAVADPSPLNGLFARQTLFVALAYPAVLAVVMVAVTLAPGWVQRPVTNRPMRWIGDISYAVFLIHFAVIWFAMRELSMPHDGSVGAVLAWCALVYPISLGYAYLSARILERPVRRWAHRFGRRAEAAPGAPTAAARPAGRPAVTIVIPTHNRASWLDGAIESVVTQDYEALEVLVIDDGSDDGTVGLLEERARRHPPGRFRFISQANAGQAATLNRGYELANGEWLGYLSDDDLLAPGAVSRLVEALEASPDAVAVYPGYHIIDEAGEVVDTITPIEYSPREALRLHDTIIGPGALARRDALESAGGWDPDLHWMGDLVLWMRVGLCGPIARVAEPLAYWRRHSQAATLQVGLEHAREEVHIAELGIRMLGGASVATADQAEALRNACILGSFFGGDSASAPGEQFAAIDLQRPQISAFGAGVSPTEPAGRHAGEATGLWRELAAATTELAELRDPGGGADRAAGLGAARELLREVGVLDGREDDAPSAAPAEVRSALMEAALHCSADTELASNRFLLIDRRRGAVADEEVMELLRFGMGASSPEQLREAIARRRLEIERLREQAGVS